MRGHVNEVPRSGREPADAIRARDSLLRIRAGLDEVNIQVIGSRMCLDAFENGLDGRQRKPGFRLGRHVLLPVIPRRGVHERLRVQDLRVDVVRVFLCHVPHCFRKRLVEV
jgi:hypothetical protein